MPPVLPLCASFLLVLASWHIGDLPIGPISLGDDGSTLDLVCHTNFTAVEADFTSARVAIVARNSSQILCDATIYNGTTKKTIFNANVTLAFTRGDITFLTRTDSRCLTTSIQHSTCDVDASIASVTLPDESIAEEFLIDYVIKSIVNPKLAPLLCDVLPALFSEQLLNHTLIPPTPLPPPVDPDAHSPTSLYTNPWVKAVLNIVQVLPLIHGLRIRLDAPQSNVLHAWIDVVAGFNLSDVPSAQQALVHPTTGIHELYMPPNTTFSLDLVVDGLQCNPKVGQCTLSGPGNKIQVMNFRLLNDGDFERLADNFVAPLLESVLNGLIKDLLFFAELKTGEVVINTPKEAHETGTMPPTWLIATVTPFLVVVYAVCMVLSFRRHKADDAAMKGIVISMLRDGFIALLCVVATGLFLWSNVTSAVTVKLGGEVNLYAFSLGNTIHDLWGAGLYPLAVLVTIFSGFYPYFKIAMILIISVVIHRPSSLLLRVIDVFGRFALLDSFVLMIIVTALKIHGVADVHVKWSFYSFLLATGMSLLAGNLATVDFSRHKRTKKLPAGSAGSQDSEQNPESSLGTVSFTPSHASNRSPPLQEGQVQRQSYGSNGKTHHQHQSPETNKRNQLVVTYQGGAVEDEDWGPRRQTPEKSSASPTPRARDDDEDSIGEIDELMIAGKEFFSDSVATKKRRCKLCSFYAILYIVGLGLVSQGVLITLKQPVLKYKFSGMGAVILGESQEYNFVRLFSETTWPVSLTGAATIIGFPIIFALLPFVRVAGAWCGTDVFIVACLAGLLQLKQFVKFVTGPMLSPLLTADAELLWPIYLLGVSVLAQWVLVARSLRVEGLRIKRRNDRRENEVTFLSES